jgi:hypothetical protein
MCGVEPVFEAIQRDQGKHDLDEGKNPRPATAPTILPICRRDEKKNVLSGRY